MKLKIAIVGIGNCASAFLQGISLYSSLKEAPSHGLMNEEIGGIKCSDIKVVAAFDIDKRKVGSEIGEAIFALPNCVKKLSNLSFHGAETIVQMGHILDGAAEHMSSFPPERSFRISEKQPSNVVQILKNSGATVLVSYLPVGSDLATQFYAKCCLEAGIAMVNCAPSFIASNPEWSEKFKLRNIPIIGDDIKSQVGATIVHRALTRLFEDRGVKLNKTYQLNTGGNTDFLNMLAKERLESKKISKTQAVTSQLDEAIDENNVHIGPSDYVPWQGDNKICFIRMEGQGFCEQKIELELRMSVQDSPNSAGIVIDAIRCAELARQKGLGGVINEPSSWLMKSPPKQFSDSIALSLYKQFIQ